MHEDLTERVLWQKSRGAGGFFFSFSASCPPLRVCTHRICQIVRVEFVLIKKEVKIEAAIVLQREKNGKSMA